MSVAVKGTVFWYVRPCVQIEVDVSEEPTESFLAFTGSEDQLLNFDYLRVWLFACINLRYVGWSILWSD